MLEPGEIFTWGFGGDGQLGLKNELTQYSPQFVHLDRADLYSRPEEGSLAIDISCGSRHTGVISSKLKRIFFEFWFLGERN